MKDEAFMATFKAVMIFLIVFAIVIYVAAKLLTGGFMKVVILLPPRPMKMLFVNASSQLPRNQGLLAPSLLVQLPS